jgi:8-amino-7-oxononanoate synthase
MSDALDWLDHVAAERSKKGLRRTLSPLGEATPGRIAQSGRMLAHFASNDYLGLAADPRVAASAHLTAQRYGWGAGASALVSGWRSPHQELADALAEFEGAEAVLLFPSGFAANLGTVSALVGPGDAVYFDKLNHASLIDGARLSGAKLRVYSHNDSDRLSSLLERDSGRFRRSLIATEGVFSMDGDLAPLPHLVELAERFSAMLLVDEAHATGVLGPDGRGASALFGVAGRVQARVGTLSKSLGSIGGFVAGSRKLIEHLVNHARTAIYSTALPPAAAAAAMEALAIAQREPWRRERVVELANRLRKSLSRLGLDIPAGVSPIVPVIVGESANALNCAAKLRDRGFLVAAVRPPTVPRGSARVRISVTAAHSDADVDGLAAAIGDCLPENGHSSKDGGVWSHPPNVQLEDGE